MASPVINLDTVTFDDIEDNGRYTSRRALFSEGIGARNLGYNLTIVPPGKVQCPFHAHRAEEEMFLILEGTGTLRFGKQTYPLRPLDVIACPTGGAEVAHQIINTGDVDLVYLAVSTLAQVEVCEYPDSGKVSVYAPGEHGLRHVFRTADEADYYAGEAGTGDA
ncbi:MAG: cupin domain-containing protein [Porphyrobacter sp. IPPAS B-1204]|nr:MAG: cupin domain-containing protein [Porphyrobacter sp. IPPAS B-1204]